MDLQDIDLTGLIDMHIHAAPDVRPRVVNDIEASRQAAEAGMRAIVFKSHVTCTADRATIAETVMPGVHVFGSVTLNEAVGGLNPVAVEAALNLGARVVWMPTISARNHIIRFDGGPPSLIRRRHSDGAPSGISLVTEEGDLQPVLFDIFDLVKQHDAVLGTAHVSVPEIVTLVREARAAGVAKVVVTHPELPWVDVPVDVQEELRDLGAAFERCYVSSIDGAPSLLRGRHSDSVPFARIVAEIQRVGLDSTVLATDFGRSPLPPPVEGMRAYVAALLAEGFSERDIQLMAGENPSRLLGLD
jgi:hypothetical protein